MSAVASEVVAVIIDAAHNDDDKNLPILTATSLLNSPYRIIGPSQHGYKSADDTRPKQIVSVSDCVMIRNLISLN